MDTWMMEQGLPENSVFAIAQSVDGYLWLGTLEGVARFDGQNFTVFNKENTPEMSTNEITSLCAARDGTLWIGLSAGGLVAYQNGSFKRFSEGDGLSSENVTALCEDREGALWIGTADKGLNKLKDGKFQNFGTQEGFSKDFIETVFVDQFGSLWVGTRRGLWRRRNNTFTKINLLKDRQRGALSITENRSGKLFVGNFRGELYSVDETTGDSKQVNLNFQRGPITSMVVDRKNSLWLGFNSSGIAIKNGETDSKLTVLDGLSSEFVVSMYLDREGSIWTGTNGGGLVRLKPNRVTVLTTKDGLPKDVILSVCEGKHNDAWIGMSQGGVAHLSRGRVSKIDIPSKGNDNSVQSVLEATDGVVWIGSSMGLFTFNEDGLKRFADSALYQAYVLSMYQDREGILWVGTGRGVYAIKGNRVVLRLDPDTFPNMFGRAVRGILEDRSGVHWFATNGLGLYRYADGKMAVFSRKTGLSSNVITSLFEDNDGVLWVCTSGGGIDRIDREKITAFTTEEGLADNMVYQIMEDSSKFFWMSSNKGIMRIAKKQLDDLANGLRNHVDCLVVGTSDGMLTSECNGGQQPAGWKFKDGRMWFPTLAGVAIVDPSSFKVNEVVPPVTIEDATLDRDRVPVSDRLIAKPGTREIQIRYAGLSLVEPRNVRYKYKLIGADDNWVDAGSRRTAFFMNLRPGEYKFRVIASNNDNVWNEQGADLSIDVEPYFYQTSWFISACILGFFSIGFVGLRFYLSYRFRGIKADQLESQLVNARLQALKMQLQPHFLFNALNTVSSLVVANPKSALKMITRLSDMLRISLEQESVQKIALRKELDVLKKYLDIEKVRFGRRLRVRYDVAKDTLDALVPSLILQPIVENSIKHGIAAKPGPGSITISSRSGSSFVELSVRDDGSRGKDLASAGHREGIGLSNTRNRLEQLYGTKQRFEYRFDQDGYFVVSIIIPFEKSPSDRITHA